jgi:hypothetical protein
VTKALSKKNKWQQTRNIALILIPAAVLAGSLWTSATIGSAEAILIPLQEHWKYNVRWDWDPDHLRTVGYIDPRIVIQNDTNGKIVGYIADQNGTRLSMYRGDQYVQIRYTYDNGFVTKWELGDKINDGYFTIEVPPAYKNADIVSIYIGRNEYSVDSGTLNVPQTSVFINSARMEYHRNATLTTVTTPAVSLQPTTTTTTPTATKAAFMGPSPGSLIDLILSRLGMLPTHSSIILQSKYASYQSIS